MRSWYARAGLILTQELGDLVVTAAKLALGAVGTDQIADAAVTTPKLAGLSVGVGKIQDGAVTFIKLASGAVRPLNMLTATDEIAGTGLANLGVAEIAMVGPAFFPMVTSSVGGFEMDARGGGSGDADDPMFRLRNNSGGSGNYSVKYRRCRDS